MKFTQLDPSGNDAKEFCKDGGPSCTSFRGVALTEQADSAADAANVLLIGGATALLGGAIIYVTSPKTPERPTLALSLGTQRGQAPGGGESGAGCGNACRGYCEQLSAACAAHGFDRYGSSDPVAACTDDCNRQGSNLDCRLDHIARALRSTADAKPGLCESALAKARVLSKA